MRPYITPRLPGDPGQTRNVMRNPVSLTMVLSLSSWCGAMSTFPSHMMPLSVEKREACITGRGGGGHYQRGGAKSTFPSHMMPLSVEKREACAGGVGEGGRGMPVR